MKDEKGVYLDYLLIRKGWKSYISWTIKTSYNLKANAKIMNKEIMQG